MAVKVKSVIFGTIALALAFIIIGSLIMPSFNTSYNPATCVTSAWANNVTTYSDCIEYAARGGGAIQYNASAVGCDTTFPACCRSCTNWGYRDTYRGLQLVVFLLAIIALAIMFMPKMRR
jgi:hypothetical protein